MGDVQTLGINQLHEHHTLWLTNEPILTGTIQIHIQIQTQIQTLGPNQVHEHHTLRLTNEPILTGPIQTSFTPIQKARKQISCRESYPMLHIFPIESNYIGCNDIPKNLPKHP